MNILLKLNQCHENAEHETATEVSAAPRKYVQARCILDIFVCFM